MKLRIASSPETSLSGGTGSGAGSGVRVGAGADDDADANADDDSDADDAMFKFSAARQRMTRSAPRDHVRRRDVERLQPLAERSVAPLAAHLAQIEHNARRERAARRDGRDDELEVALGQREQSRVLRAAAVDGARGRGRG